MLLNEWNLISVAGRSEILALFFSDEAILTSTHGWYLKIPVASLKRFQASLNQVKEILAHSLFSFRFANYSLSRISSPLTCKLQFLWISAAKLSDQFKLSQHFWHAQCVLSLCTMLATVGSAASPPAWLDILFGSGILSRVGWKDFRGGTAWLHLTPLHPAGWTGVHLGYLLLFFSRNSGTVDTRLSWQGGHDTRENVLCSWMPHYSTAVPEEVIFWRRGNLRDVSLLSTPKQLGGDIKEKAQVFRRHLDVVLNNQL